MEDYGEMQFVEGRNAVTVQGRSQNGQPTQGGRTFYAQPVQGQRYYNGQPVYGAPGYPPGYNGNSLFGRLTTGHVIDLVAQIFAALMPLPAQPVGTSDADTDVGNLMLYQGSLASYAKRDEQIRTLGNIVTKLVG